MSARSKWSRFLLERGGLISFVALVTYVLLAPAYIVDGDNAEFSTVGASGGRAHPSGYPVYVLYLRLMSWIPASSPSHAAAIATAFLGAAAVLTMHAACRAWGARPVSASLAVAIYAASPVVLRMHVQAEVFALNALVVATVLWLSATTGPARGARRAALLGLVAGLGMGNHLTCVLVAPVGLLGIARALGETRDRVAAILLALAGLVLGLSSYAYLLVADGPVSFGRVEDFGDVLSFFLRMDYGGPTAFVPTPTSVTPATNLRELAMTIGRGWLWPLAIGAALVLAFRVIRPGTHETRAGWIALALSFVLAGPLLVLRFNIDPDGLGRYVIQRFHLLPLLVLVIPTASMFDLVLRDRVRTSVAAILAPVAFLALTATSIGWVRGVHSRATETAIHNLLRSLPPNAVVAVNQEDICFGAVYVQHVLGVRPDVVIACWPLTSRDWYVDRLAVRGVSIGAVFSPQVTRAQAEAILASRPLFVDRSMTTVATEMPAYPWGIVMRVLPPGSAVPRLEDMLAFNVALYERFDLRYPRPRAGDDYAAIAHQRYAATWRLIARALAIAGKHERAREALEIAAQLVPLD